MSQVIEEPNLRVLYTADERYTLKRSFYSKKISTSNSALHPSQFLTITVDAEVKQELEQQIKVKETHSALFTKTKVFFNKSRLHTVQRV